MTIPWWRMYSRHLNDRFVGTLNYFRIFAGKISSDGRYTNSNSGAERTLQFTFRHAW